MRKPKILVVEDNNTNVQLITESLRLSNYDTVVATDGEAALECAFSQDADLILLDVMIPKMDGYEVCSKLKSNPLTSETPIIFLTARTDSQSILKGFEHGAVDYVTKPFGPKVLLARIKTHLDLKFAKEELQKELAERKRIDAALKNNFEFLKILLNTIPSPIFYIDFDGRYLGCNPSFAQTILGVPEETVIGRTALDFEHVFTPERAREFHVNSQSYSRDVGHQVYETKIRCHDGILRDYIHSEATYYTIDGAPSGKVAILQDITELKNAEKIIRESEERYRTIVNSANDGISVWNLQGRLIDANLAFCNMHEQTLDALNDIDFQQGFSSGDRHNFVEVGKCIAARQYCTFEGEHHALSGKAVPVEVSCKQIRYRDEEAVLAVSRDITERKEIQRRIIEAIIETEEKERSRFAKDLHDGLGALLSSINIYINLILSGTLKPDEIGEMLTFTRSLIDDAITSAKEVANNIRPATLSNFGLITSVNSFCEKINRTGAVAIEFDYAQFNAQLDKNLEIMVHRIVSELINNTLKHAQAQNVTIVLSCDEKYVFLTYTDDGKGFDVDESLNKKNSGMGLSNIVSRVKSVNGLIDFQSQPGRGVTVNITLTRY